MKSLERYISKIKDALEAKKFDSVQVEIIDDKIAIRVKEEYRDHEFIYDYDLSRLALKLMDDQEKDFDPYKELARFLRDQMDAKMAIHDFSN